MGLLGTCIYIFGLSVYWALAKTFGFMQKFVCLVPLYLHSPYPAFKYCFYLFSWLRIWLLSVFVYMDYDFESSSPTSHDNVSMADLLEGVCVDYLNVKIEKMILKQVLRYPFGRLGPAQASDQLQLVIFDKSVGFLLAFLALFE